MLKNIRYILSGILLLLTDCNFYAQSAGYRVSLVPFSTLTNDEFSPVYYKHGIVFCSDLKNNSLINYKKDQNNLVNIFYVDRKDSSHWTKARLLARELTTNYNDGPATFSITGDTVYYCRNNNISEELWHVSDTTNKLGIYSAVFINGKWTNIRLFTYDNPMYSFVTPALSPDGKRLYFASDMPGGYGEADLYYCDRKGDGWGKPVNLGPAINTPKNESYPFISTSGKLFFASDGHPGFGGKDLYYSQEIKGKWIDPIHLDAAINSPYDDFGLVTDANFENGYFSSNRRKTDDIYSFETNPVQFSSCDSMVKNDFCYTFYDEFQNRNDTAPVIYEWDFGNGIKKYGLQVNYCFPGPGKYEVKLNLLDSQKPDSVVSQTIYKFELKDVRQAYINSPDAGIVEEPVSFDGLKSSLPDFKVTDYVWNFGDGFTVKGPEAYKTFRKKGDYIIKLGLLGERDSIGSISKVCVSKRIKIFEDYQELAMHRAKEISDLGESCFLKDSADTCISINREEDPQILKNPNSLRVRIFLMNNLSELQKKKIVENLYEIRNCTINISDTGINAASVPVLNKFSNVLNEIPGIRLEIAVHTGNKKLFVNNQEESEKWAHDFYSWFLNNGISSDILHCKGYGSSRPVMGKKNNNRDIGKRVEFIFIKI